jgi:NAD(P)-dependent dehydrogenase (short-subunit alcohol dehydrogenase family)
MGATRLDGRRVIVTGGASGMGAGVVRAFPALGASVVSLDLAESSGRAIAEEVGAGFVPVNVASKESVDTAFDSAVAILGGLDVLVHAAGIAPASSAEQTSVELWTTVLSVNALGTMLTNQAAFRALKDHGGAIINFASAAGVHGYPNKVAYAASKGAVVAFTRTIAREWAPYRVTANMLAPSIWTPMYDKTRSEMTAEQLTAHDAVMAKAIPLGGKLGDVVEDFVPVLAFYSSDGARFITGQIIAIDGGSLMVR